MIHTFTGTGGSLPTQFKTPAQEGEVFVFVGSEGSEDFGGGTLKIQKVRSDGTLSTLKEITVLDTQDDRSMRVILPGNQLVDVTLTGASAADLGIEIQSGSRRNP